MYLLVGVIGVLFSTWLAIYCSKKKFSIKKSMAFGFFNSFIFFVLVSVILLAYANSKGITAAQDNIGINMIYGLVYSFLSMFRCYHEVTKEDSN